MPRVPTRDRTLDDLFKSVYRQNRSHIRIKVKPEVCPDSCPAKQKITKIPTGRERATFNRALKVLFLSFAAIRNAGVLPVSTSTPESEQAWLVQKLLHIWLYAPELFQAILKRTSSLQISAVWNLLRNSRQHLHKH